MFLKASMLNVLWKWGKGDSIADCRMRIAELNSCRVMEWWSIGVMGCEIKIMMLDTGFWITQFRDWGIEGFRN